MKLPQRLNAYLFRPGLIGCLVRLVNRRNWTVISHIPDQTIIWRVVCRKSQVSATGEVKHSFFRDKNGLSCEIALLTTRKRALRGVSWPPGTGLREFVAGVVLAVSGGKSKVHHDPLREPATESPPKKPIINYAHCIVMPQLETAASKDMVQKSKYRVRPDLKRLTDLGQE